MCSSPRTASHPYQTNTVPLLHGRRPPTPSHRLPCFLHSLSTSDRVTTPPRFLRAVVVGFQVQMRWGWGASSGLQATGMGNVKQQLCFNKGLFQFGVASGSLAQTCPPFQKQHCGHTAFLVLLWGWCYSCGPAKSHPEEHGASVLWELGRC